MLRGAFKPRAQEPAQALLTAAAYGDMVALQEEIRKNKNRIDAADGAGKNALLYALENGFEEHAALLLHHGARHDVTAATGETALMFACAKMLSGATEKLLLQGADMNVRDYMDDTALMKAARAGHGWAACRLVAAGADMDAQNKNGETAESLARENLPPREFVCFMNAVQARHQAAAASAQEKIAAQGVLQRDIVPLKVIQLRPRPPRQ